MVTRHRYIRHDHYWSHWTRHLANWSQGTISHNADQTQVIIGHLSRHISECYLLQLTICIRTCLLYTSDAADE